MNTKYIIFGCVLLLVVLISMSSACGVIPYSATTRSYAVVEGVETKAEFNDSVNKLLDEFDKLSDIDNETKKKIKDIRNLGVDGYDMEELKVSLTNLSSDKSSELYKLTQKFIEEKLENTLDEPTDEQEEEDKEIEGFTTGMSGTSIDIFSSAIGNQNCVKTASGLSNSMGALCLTKEHLYMLQSRGGNSTGRDSQIGA